MLTKFSQTFSQELGRGIGEIFGVLFGLISIFIFASFFSLVLLALILLRKFAFTKNRVYLWTVKAAGLLISLASISFMTSIMAAQGNLFGFVIIPLVPLLLGIYCIFKLK